MKKCLMLLIVILIAVPGWAVYHKLGEFTDSSRMSNVEVVDQIAYISDPDYGLRIVDVSDPTNPQLIGTYQVFNYCGYVTVLDNVAYLLVLEEGLLALDVSSPDSPRLLGTYPLSVLSPSFVTIRDDIAYVANYNYGFRLIDVSNPAEMVQLFEYEMEGYIHNLALEGNLLYLADGEAYIKVFNVSDPANPVLLNESELPGEASWITVQDGIAYIASRFDGLQIVDVSDFMNIQPIATIEHIGNAQYVLVQDQTLYLLSEGSGLRVYDIADPVEPSLLGVFNTFAHVRAPFISNQIAYIPDCNDGLQIIDIIDPENELLLGSYDTGNRAWGIEVDYDLAFIANSFSGMKVVDFSNPVFPLQLSEYATDSPSKYIAYRDNHVYLSEMSCRFHIIDVSNPFLPTMQDFYEIYGCSTGSDLFANVAFIGHIGSIDVVDFQEQHQPRLLSNINTPGVAASCKLVNNLLYVADGEAGLQIVDVKDLENPEIVGNYSTVLDAIEIAIKDEVAYVAGVTGLYAIDISNPGQPEYILDIRPRQTSEIRDCLVHGNLLFFSCMNWNEIYLYDISVPEAPVHLRTFSWNMTTYDMCYYNRKLYTANDYHGVSVLDLDYLATDDAENVSLPVQSLSNYPNPFNPSTAIRFSLREDMPVTLAIYNIRGQKVRTLIDERMERGEHTAQWLGDDDSGKPCSSGVYLYRMRTAGKTETKKMIMMK